MAITVKHSKVSTIPDDADTSLVRPSDWNADHTLTGTVPVANGGTGASTAADGLNNLLPSQTGNNGKVLATDGTNATWTTNGSGDVVGPSSATDNAVARFDTTTGKLIQNSVTLIDDTGNASGILSQQFSNGSAVTLAAGKMWYDGTTGAWNAGMGNGNITQQIGEEVFVYGKASAAITDSPLQIIYQTGATGASGVITFAPTTAGITDGTLILGVATENLALNGFGRITSYGVVRGITTNGTAFGETWADNDEIYYNPVTGNPTNIKPVAPNVKVSVGTLIHAGAGGSGSIQVEINHGSVLGGTDSNVQLTSVTNGNILTYDGGNNYWKNTDLTAGTGISVSKSANGVLTVTNTSPSSGGTVTSVAALTLGTSGTDLSSTVANGTTTPVITLQVPTASAANRGALSSADWTTFNNKGSGTVTSVGFTGGIISVGTATTTPAFTVAGTSGGIPYFSSGTTWATSAALAANALVIGGGAGVAPSTTTTGTGVVTALGVNTDTAGAFVVNGGALGIPSSGTVTNLTGTASININGTVGATTQTTGRFTSIDCTSVTDTSALARNGGKTANTTINNTTTYTTGGVTLATQSAATGSVWRVRAFGQYTAANSATARTARVACFWGATQLTAITSTVLTGTAQTTQWQCEFTLTASSATAIWTTGTMIGRTASATALAIDNATPASTTGLTTTSTLDLRFSMSSATPADSWIVQSVTMERLE